MISDLDQRRLALAMLPPVCALALQWALWDWIRPLAWFLFFPAVFLSSWIGGRRAGWLSTALSILIVWWFFLPPEHGFGKTSPHHFFPTAVFAGMGLLYSHFHDRLKQANRDAVALLARVSAASEENRRLYREAESARAALSERDARLSEAQRIARLGSWSLDLRDASLVWSDECYRIFEKDPARDTPSYATFLAAIHPDDRAAVDAAYARSLAGRAPYAIEHRLLFADGRVKYVREHGETEYDGDRPVRSQGTVQDITAQRLAEAAQRESEARYRLLFDAMEEGVFGVDAAGRCAFVNPAGLRLLGYASVDELVGRPLPALIRSVCAETADESCALRRAIAEGRAHASDDERFLRADGSALEVACRVHPLPDGGVAVTFSDIGERKRADRHLRQAAIVFDSASEGIIVTDAQARVVAVNAAFEKISGYRAEEILGRNPRLQQSGRQDADFYRRMWERLAAEGRWQGEIWNRRKNGESYPAWESISEVADADGRVTHYVSVLSDISPIKQAEEKLRHQAHHDALTGLPNRLLFTSSLELAIEQARRQAAPLALLFLDLDEFKRINDTLGHAVGDRLLQVVAARLKASVRATDTVARLGGDEFTLVMGGLSAPEDAALLARKLIEAVREPVLIDEHELAVSVSVGISIFPDNATDSADLARAADTALYRAKARGRNTYEFYTHELTVRARERLKLEQALRGALARDELVLHYQPQIELASGRIVGVEALLRWQHPQLGLLGPDRFIDVAEDSSLIDAIGEWVLAAASRQLAAWRRAGRAPLRMAVNISGRHLLRADFADRLEAILGAAGLLATAPCDLEIEITESTLHRVEESGGVLERVKALGVRLAVDDFGAGHSSLSHLRYLPIDTLKIDRAFVSDLSHSAQSVAIVEAIVALGRGLGLQVVGEGVETAAQRDCLARHGCDLVQGFLYSRAVPAATLDGLLGAPGFPAAGGVAEQVAA